MQVRFPLKLPENCSGVQWESCRDIFIPAFESAITYSHSIPISTKISPITILMIPVAILKLLRLQ